MDPSAQAAAFLAGGHRGGGLVQVQRAGVSDADQPDTETGDDGGEEASGKVVVGALRSGAGG